MELRTPWIGNRFDGLLVLGESHYHDDADAPGLTTQVVEEAVAGESPHALFAKVEKVVTGEIGRRTGDASFWQTVAFANFYPGVVPGPRKRPTPEMCEEGYRLFPALLSMVKPRRILVLGNVNWNNVGELTNTIDIQTVGAKREAGRLGAEAGLDGEGLPITSIRHPSAWGFSTMRWHAYYQDFVAAFPKVTG